MVPRSVARSLIMALEAQRTSRHVHLDQKIVASHSVAVMDIVAGGAFYFTADQHYRRDGAGLAYSGTDRHALRCRIRQFPVASRQRGVIGDSNRMIITQIGSDIVHIAAPNSGGGGARMAGEVIDRDCAVMTGQAEFGYRARLASGGIHRG